jgi:predicted metal-dependent phosphoesterase TrpH
MSTQGATYDLHVHSRCSRDSALTPEAIVKAAKRGGLRGVAVTDHETVKGGLEARRAALGSDLTIIVGYETRIQGHDVLCLFVEEENRAGCMAELHDKIRESGGITVLAHPYRMFMTADRGTLNDVDAVEVLNARLSSGRNRRALELADDLHMPKVAGSDAHSLYEIGRAYTIIRGDSPREGILRGLSMPGGTESPLWVSLLSLLARRAASATHAARG